MMRRRRPKIIYLNTRQSYINLVIALILIGVIAYSYFFDTDSSPPSSSLPATETIAETKSPQDVSSNTPLPSLETNIPPAGTNNPESIYSPYKSSGSIIVSFTSGVSSVANSDVLNTLVPLLQNARRSIYGAIYDFDYEPIADLLIQKFREGVDVGLVVEAENSSKQAILMCEQAGIPVVRDLNSAYMHNKFFVVDGMYTWTGSTNLTWNCLFYNNNNSVIVASPEVSENYFGEFLEMFQMRSFGRGSPRNTMYENVRVGNAVVTVYFAPEDGVEAKLLGEISNARRNIYFLAFSFTSGAVAERLVLARGNGLDVKGVFEKRNAGNPSSKDEYLASMGIEVRYDSNPKTMHSKVFIFDDETVWTGSYNFSENADKRNDENVIVIRDSRIAQVYIYEFSRIFNSGVPVGVRF